MGHDRTVGGMLIYQKSNPKKHSLGIALNPACAHHDGPEHAAAYA